MAGLADVYGITLHRVHDALWTADPRAKAMTDKQITTNGSINIFMLEDVNEQIWRLCESLVFEKVAKKPAPRTPPFVLDRAELGDEISFDYKDGVGRDMRLYSRVIKIFEKDSLTPSFPKYQMWIRLEHSENDADKINSILDKLKEFYGKRITMRVSSYNTRPIRVKANSQKIVPDDPTPPPPPEPPAALVQGSLF